MGGRYGDSHGRRRQVARDDEFDDPLRARSALSQVSLNYDRRAPPTPAHRPALYERSKTRPYVYLDLAGNGERIGRVVIELRDDVVPKTADNFRALCTGERGAGYRGAAVHRVVSNFCVHGGAVDGVAPFADENFRLRHSAPGVVAMANFGPDTNASAFYICTAPAPWLDGRHVVVGRVVEGYDVVTVVEGFGSPSGAMRRRVTIQDAGQLDS